MEALATKKKLFNAFFEEGKAIRKVEVLAEILIKFLSEISSLLEDQEKIYWVQKGIQH